MKLSTLVLLLAACFLPGLAQPLDQGKSFSNAATANGLIDKAVELSSAGDHVAALMALEEALAFCPNDARLHLDQAIAKLRDHDLAGSQAEIIEAYRRYPPLGKIFYISGFTRMLAKDFYGAIQDLSLSLYIDPGQFFQYMPRGQARFEVGDYQGAIEDFSMVINSPRQTAIESVYLARGRARFELGDGPGALADLTKAINLNRDPQMFEAYTFRSWQYFRDGNLPAAISDCSKAITINPRFIRHFSDRSWFYHETNNSAAAHRDANDAIALQPELPRSWLYRGALYETEDQTELAAADYLKSIALAKARGGSWVYAAFSLDLLNRRTGRPPAQEYLKDVLDWPDGWPKRVAIYLAGKTADASLERDARNTTDPREKAHQECEAFYYIGVNHLIRGENDVARTYLEKTVSTGQVRLLEYRQARAHLARLAKSSSPGSGNATTD